MAAIVHSVPLSAKEFTPEHLKLSKLYVNLSVYPGLYDNKELREGFEFVDRRIVSIESINLDIDNNFTDLAMKGYGAAVAFIQSAAIRANSRGENADKVQASMVSDGFELCHLPISVALCPNQKEMILDGRTRLEQLERSGFKNVIVDYYKCDNWDAYFTEALKRNPIEKPRSPMKKEDIIAHCSIAIDRGWINRDAVAIENRIKEITGNSVNYNTLQKIIGNVMYGAGHTASVLSLSEETATNWLKRYGYISNDKNNGIYYKVVSASAWSKAVCQAADYLVELEENGKRVKELRIVLHTGTLEGADPVKSWQGKIDSFRNGWKQDLNNVAKSFFAIHQRRATVKLYGAIPAVVALSNLYPMDKLVMFHVGKLKDQSFNEINLDEELEYALLS
jgi:hypothetical protein